MTTLTDLLATKARGLNEANPTDGALDAWPLIQKYDPNASINDRGEIVYDQSQLPKMSSQLQAVWDKSGGGSGNNNKFQNNFSQMYGDKGVGNAELKNQSQVIHDPFYGDYTWKGNLKQAPGDSTSGFMGQMEKYMPTVISAIMAAGIGAGAGPALGGVINAGMRAGDNLSMGKGLSLQSMLGSLAGMTGIPGASSLMNYIMQQMQQQKIGG